jgi:CheY-like chemotaxis protein
MSNSLQQMPTILLIEDDDESRRLLVANLRDRGYRILSAFDEQNAIDWILSNEEISIDFILINQVEISIQKCVERLNFIYQRTGLSPTIPSVIIADRYQAALEGTEEQFNDNKYIIYLENIQQLFDLLHRLYCNN